MINLKPNSKILVNVTRKWHIKRATTSTIVRPNRRNNQLCTLGKGLAFTPIKEEFVEYKINAKML